ncbi:MAG: hypothetical protein JST07_10870 [Bacteroidetes bacterium]|nr:hypothetical protein [Bacteroidota bacterium]
MKTKQIILYFSFCISILFLALILSCNTDTENPTRDKEELSFPFSSTRINLDSLTEYNPFNISTKEITPKPYYTIITYINVSCSVCIAEIDKWNEFFDTASNGNLQIKLIFYSEDKFEYIKYLSETNGIKKFPFPFYLDNKETFAIKNPIFKDKTVDKTILINKNGNIVLIGNPLHSKEIESKYLNKIQQKNN